MPALLSRRAVCQACWAAAIAVALAASPAHGAATRPGVYEGMTVIRTANANLSHPMSLRVTRDRRVRLSFLELKACASGPVRVAGGDLAPRLRRGVLQLDTTVTRDLGEGRTMEVKLGVSGRIAGADGRGIIRARATLTDAQGAIFDTCDSGAMRWTAHRGSGLAGRTAQRLPVTIRRVRGGREIRRLWISYRTPVCPVTGMSLGGSLKIKDLVFDAAGEASRSATRIDPATGGGTIEQTYTLTASRGARSIAGTLQVTVTLRAEDGSVREPPCTTPPILWRAVGNR